MEMAIEGRINFEGFITQRFSLDAYKEAFRVIQTRPGEVIKVVFEIS
jgi:threonine dehydrogenase-like Zn-dependent dehydrogenase